jgi:predicted transposase YbfD/YdcC
VASGQQTVRAIGQWASEHHESLVAALKPRRGRLPSTITLYRALRAVEPAALERVVGSFVEQQDNVKAPKGRWQGQAIDGKTLRGALAHGRSVHLVGLARHGSGAVVAQQAVAEKANEIAAAPQLLAGRDLRGTVTTMDALLAQRSLAGQILAQGGHYLVSVKRNQPTLYEDIALWFESPARLVGEAGWDEVTTVGKGHGRLERRTLVASTALNDYVTWPGVGQVLKRTCRRVILKTGRVHEATSYAITSLTPEQASAAELEALWRDHWTIENRTHYVRDVTFGEDAGQAHCGHTPHNLAVIRNALIVLVRRHHWSSVADAIRHYGASPDRALGLVTGPSPPRL